MPWSRKASAMWQKLGSNYPKPSPPSHWKVTFVCLPRPVRSGAQPLRHRWASLFRKPLVLYWMNVHLKKMAREDGDASGSDRSRNMWLNIWYCNIHICVFAKVHNAQRNTQNSWGKMSLGVLQQCYYVLWLLESLTGTHVTPLMQLLWCGPWGIDGCGAYISVKMS